MKSIAHRVSSIPHKDKAIVWFKLISITGGAQLIVQMVGLVSGILVIRMLPTNEYALYTLANTMLGTMVMLTDSGISTGVMAQGSKVWQNRTKLGSVLVTGLDLRKKFAVGSLIISTPFLLYLLRGHGASWLVSVLLVISLVPAFLTSLSGTMLSIPPRLQQDIVPLQKNQVVSNVGRLCITTLVLFTFPFAYLTIFAAGIPQIWANRKLRKISVNYADWDQKPDMAIRKEILTIVKKILPGTVYFCLYSQITIWLCSFINSTEAVAQAGALGRLVMVLGLFNMVFSTLITPRFSRLQENYHLLIKRFIQIFGGLLLLSCFIIGIVWIFPSQVLWILGKGYANLTTEIVLNVIGSCLSFIAGSVVGLYTSRGWVLNPVISILVSLASLASGALLFKLSTLQGIFIFNIYLALIQMLMYLIYILYKIKKTSGTSNI